MSCEKATYLATVRMAARLAVNVARIRTMKIQNAETRIRAERALGESPPPWGVTDVVTNQRHSMNVKILFKKKQRQTSGKELYLNLLT